MSIIHMTLLSIIRTVASLRPRCLTVRVQELQEKAWLVVHQQSLSKQGASCAQLNNSAGLRLLGHWVGVLDVPKNFEAVV